MTQTLHVNFVCVLCSDLNVISNFIRFLFHDRSVKLFWSHYLDKWLTADKHIFATFHWTYSKGQFTSSIMEHRCTLHTILFGLHIMNQNSKFKPEHNEVWIRNCPHICTSRGMHRGEDNTKLDLKETEEIVWTGLIWPRTTSSSAHLWTQ